MAHDRTADDAQDLFSRGHKALAKETSRWNAIAGAVSAILQEG